MIPISGLSKIAELSDWLCKIVGPPLHPSEFGLPPLRGEGWIMSIQFNKNQTGFEALIQFKNDVHLTLAQLKWSTL